MKIKIIAKKKKDNELAQLLQTFVNSKTYQKELEDTVYVSHLYQTKGFQIGNKKQKRTHACLKYGYWCWKNALENPKMAIKFIIYKLKKLCV